MEESSCLNFDVRFTKDGSGYRAEIVESPGGTGQHTFAFPFHERDLENYLLKIGNRRSGMRSSISAADEAALEFGNKLFETVFCGELETAFEKSLEVTRNAGSRLRIRLRLGETPELADLPWEYLYQSRRKRFLARSDYFPVVRYFDLPGKHKPLAVTPPLRVLVMLSNPSDVESLEVEDEYKKLKEAVKALEEEKLLAVERLGRATLGALQDRLRKDSYHIFHFIGHGQFDPVTKQSFLALEHENGRVRLVSGVDIGSYLSDEHSLRLVILNACEGGRASVNDATSGVAQSLVLQGIPAVIAMQFEVSDKAAIALAGGFYEALADNYPVDAALSEARKAIYAADCGVEWGTPVLYLHAPDGRIFDVAKASDTQRQRSQINALLKESEAALTAKEFELAEEKLNQVLRIIPGEPRALAQLDTVLRHKETANLCNVTLRHHEAGTLADEILSGSALFHQSPAATPTATPPDLADEPSVLSVTSEESLGAHKSEASVVKPLISSEEKLVRVESSESPAAVIVPPRSTNTTDTKRFTAHASARPVRPRALGLYVPIFAALLIGSFGVWMWVSKEQKALRAGLMAKLSSLPAFARQEVDVYHYFSASRDLAPEEKVLIDHWVKKRGDCEEDLWLDSDASVTYWLKWGEGDSERWKAMGAWGAQGNVLKLLSESGEVLEQGQFAISGDELVFPNTSDRNQTLPWRRTGWPGSKRTGGLD